MTTEELLALDVDVLIPAALAETITAKNAANVKAKIVLELANGPVTPEADKLLYGKGINVIPDILANAGGVIVSYYEWVQNQMGYYWEEEEVLEKLKKQIIPPYNTMYELSSKEKFDLRTAAYLIATKRILEAAKLRGRV